MIYGNISRFFSLQFFSNLLRKSFKKADDKYKKSGQHPSFLIL